MNPLASEAVASILRSILKIAAGYLVAKGVWTGGDAATYVSAAALALVGLGWSYWTTYASRLKLLTALTLPTPKTEAQLTDHIAAGLPVPKVTTPITVVPVAVPVLVKA